MDNVDAVSNEPDRMETSYTKKLTIRRVPLRGNRLKNYIIMFKYYIDTVVKNLNNQTVDDHIWLWQNK